MQADHTKTLTGYTLWKTIILYIHQLRNFAVFVKAKIH